ncbi:MAG TPA: OmpA family protein [Burkholderiaceae bacterium]|nr:OmpA family protein [Burkholderiaceae bacterium]
MDDGQDNEQCGLVAWVLGIAVTVAIAVSLLTGIVGALNAGGGAAASASGRMAGGAGGSLAGSAGAAGSTVGAAAGSMAGSAAGAASASGSTMAGAAAGGTAGAAAGAGGVASAVAGAMAAPGAVATGGQMGAAQPDLSHLPLVDAVSGSKVIGPLRVFFELGRFEPPADAAGELAPVVTAVKEGKAEKVFLSGFHDRTGDPAKNAELAKQRAIAIRALLLEQGLTEKQVVLVKPAETTGDGSDREARRVEVTATGG